MYPRGMPEEDGLQFKKVPTKGEGEDGNDSCHELQIRLCILLLDQEHIQRGGCLQSCDIPSQEVRVFPYDHSWQLWLDAKPIANEGHMGEAGPLLRLRCPLVCLLKRKLPSPLGNDASPSHLKHKHKGYFG